MKPKQPTLFEIQRRGLKALTSALGHDGVIRFFQLYEMGNGDYTKDRKKWLNKYSMEDIAAKIRAKRKGK